MHHQKHKIGEYKHGLRNYVYYSEHIKEGDTDIVINYTLDNYIAVSGTIDGTYVTKAGYLVYGEPYSGYSSKKAYTEKDLDLNSIKLSDDVYPLQRRKTYDVKYYYGIKNDDGKFEFYKKEGIDDSVFNYYLKADAFTQWFTSITIHLPNNYSYLKNLFDNTNNPEDPNSLFNQHKREIIKNKIEEVLNSSITAYSEKTGNDYKMPQFLEEDWEKIYNNISVISLVQGMNLGFKSYNNYCILNSTNNKEYVNPNLMYFLYDGEYHDIRCEKLKEVDDLSEIEAYKIGDFEKIKTENSEGKTVYTYKNEKIRQATACYKCINGSLETTQTIYEYVNSNETKDIIREAYYMYLAKERYNTTKLLDNFNGNINNTKCFLYIHYPNENIATVQCNKGDLIEIYNTEQFNSVKDNEKENQVFFGKWYDENENEISNVIWITDKEVHIYAGYLTITNKSDHVEVERSHYYEDDNTEVLVKRLGSSKKAIFNGDNKYIYYYRVTMRENLYVTIKCNGIIIREEKEIVPN